MGAVGSSAVPTFRSGHTRRPVEGNAGYQAAMEWARAPAAQLGDHPGAERFRELIRSVSSMDRGITAYRGRPKGGSLPQNPTYEDMGSGKREGRYNVAVRPALYLCEIEEGVARELGHWCPGAEVLVQEYHLPVPPLRIADCAQTGIPDFIGAAFHFAERANVTCREGRNDYAFSQLLADLVAEAGFEGMRVPGVRGGDGIWYSNIVLFDAREKWRGWVRTDMAPRPISSMNA